MWDWGFFPTPITKALEYKFIWEAKGKSEDLLFSYSNYLAKKNLCE